MVWLIVDLRSIAWVLGGFLGVLALMMIAPLGFALAYEPELVSAMLSALLMTLAVAVLLLGCGWRRIRPSLKDREAILLVVMVWIAICVLGAMPLYLSSYYSSYSDAFFEATSGFTTTGATVISDIDGLPRTVHLWRSISHWFGGMGIVLLGVAILPLIGQGGMEMYRAEFSGATSERLRPRVIEIARALWKIYLLLTAVLFVCLWAAGMSAFDALCHAFSTLATGGFSTRTDSIAGFGSPLIEYIVILFMILASISFLQHYRFWVEHNAAKVLKDYEIRTFLAVIVVSVVLIAIGLPGDWGLEAALRASLFQVVSIMTGTGFVSENYGAWQPLAQLLLLILMFIGGCTGSTTGGLKVARIALLIKVVRREFSRIAEPHGVFRIRLGDGVIAEGTVSALLNLLYLAAINLMLASLVLTATGVDVLSAIAAAAACQFNIGPGLAAVGPVENYGGLSDLAKWVLSFCMIAGRLEFYTFLVVLSRAFWHR